MDERRRFGRGYALKRDPEPKRGRGLCECMEERRRFGEANALKRVMPEPKRGRGLCGMEERRRFGRG